MDGGPNGLISAQPEAGSQYSGSDMVTFRWTPDLPLEDGQLFELVFWSPEETWNDSRSPDKATEATELTVRPDKADLNGSYRWGVLLVRLTPQYKRLRLLGPGYPISFSGSSGSDSNGGDNGNNGGGGNAPTKPGG
jgi:hypothetical protein